MMSVKKEKTVLFYPAEEEEKGKNRCGLGTALMDMNNAWEKSAETQRLKETEKDMRRNQQIGAQWEQE